MPRRKFGIKAAALPGAVAFCLWGAAAARPEAGSFHLVKIVEVFPGSLASPNAQYVELQMYSAFQNLVTGIQLNVFDSTGALVDSFTFTSDLANFANQASILIATPEAVSLFNLPGADLTMTPVIAPRGGKICFFDPGLFGDIDCFSWGNYAGSAVGTGNPFNPAQGLSRSAAAQRRLNICFSPTVLDFCDDTNNSLTDFLFAAPAPRNNAGQTGSPPPSTCGNGIIEGLESCDDGNTTAGDGCDPLCRVEPPCVKGDVNFDGALTSSDVVLMLNCVFLGAGVCPFCATDINCDGFLTSSDVVRHLNVVFLGAPLPC